MNQCSVVKTGKCPGFGISLVDGHISMNFYRLLSQYHFNLSILSFPPQAARVMRERAGVFPCLLLITNIPIEAFLVAFDIPGQIQCQFGFDCPSYIFVCSDSISVLFPGYLSLLSPSVVFFFFFFFLFCFVRSMLFIIRMDYYSAWTRRLLTIKQPFCPLVSPSPYPEGLYHADP